MDVVKLIRVLTPVLVSTWDHWTDRNIKNIHIYVCISYEHDVSTFKVHVGIINLTPYDMNNLVYMTML